MAGFNKTYRNYPLRFGIVVKSYPISDPTNHTKLAPEYDVQVFEQQEDEGSSIVTYRNCLAVDSLGSVADFFEKTLRVKENSSQDSSIISAANQNGATVLLLCLDAVSEKAIIISALNHPDRPTTLTGTDPHLEGEFNGVNIQVNVDGSTSLTFKGATDNDGNPTDITQGNTVITIEKDGSFQTSHSTITNRLDRNGQSTLTTKDDINNVSGKDFNVSTQGQVEFTAIGDYNASCQNFLLQAQGSATLGIQKLSIQSQSDIALQGTNFTVQASAMASIKASTITLDGVVALGGDGGSAVLTLQTMFVGVGNLGAPVISHAIAGFATKVTAQ